MEHGNDGCDTINPLEPERKINQHPQHGIDHRPFGLGLQLLANLGPDDAHVSHPKIGEEVSILQCGNHRRINHTFHVVERRQHTTFAFIAKVYDLLGNRRIALVGLHTRMQRVFLQQVIRHAQDAGIIQILLAGRSILFECFDDQVLAAVQRLLVGLLLGQVDQHLVTCCRPKPLNLGLAQPSPVQRRPNRIIVRRVGELHLDQGSAAEVDTQRDVVPEQH